jgi:hypothetical protein
MPKPTPTPEQLAARKREPDATPALPGTAPDPSSPEALAAAVAASGEADEIQTGGEGELANAGYDVPASPVMQRGPAVLARADQALSAAQALGITRQKPTGESPLKDVTPVVRNYANEQFVDEMVEGGGVVDLMTANASGFQVFEPVDPDTFREFKTKIEYEQFMLEPVVIRVHGTRDKTEPTKVFVGVNGNTRWLLREINYRIPRFLVERLAQAQERSYETKEHGDPQLDNAMKTLSHNAASYSFSVLHDPNPVGRRWLQRCVRQGS